MRGIVILAVLLRFAAAGVAAAAPAPAAPSRPATAVEVITLDGEKIRGSLLDLGSESVTLLVEEDRRTLALERVARIETRRDSLKNGFIIGAVVLGGWCAYICGQAIPNHSELPIAIAANAMFGGLVGIAIDATNPHRRILYRSGPPATIQLGTRFTLSW